MLAVIQLPFTDARPFLGIDTGALRWPNWPVPREDIEYIRSFGSVRRRLRGGVSDWPAEQMYSDASKAVRFPDKRIEIEIPDSDGQKVSPYCAFRRFMVDGRFPTVSIDGEAVVGGAVVSRLEIGLAFRRKKRRALELNCTDTLAIIRVVTQIPTKIQAEDQTQALLTVGPKLAAAYLAASTRRTKGRTTSTERWWFRVGSPLLVMEYHPGEIVELPKYSRTITALNQIGIGLDHCRVQSNGLRFGVWFIGVKDPNRADENRDRVRRLRLNLLRLHAERDSVKQVLRLIAQQHVTIKRGSPASERVQQFLDESIRLLSKKERDGLPQSEILEAAQDYEDLVSPGEKETLLTQLSSIRKTLLQRVDKITNNAKEQSGSIYEIHAESVVINNEQNGNKTVNTQTIDFGSGNTITDVNIVAAKTIQDSWNRVAAANTKPEIRTALQDLHKSVAEMTKQLPEQKQSEVAKDLATFSSEATSAAPRRQWYELSAEGLIEAAKAVGEIAAPVATTVKAILTLLG